MAVDLNDDFSDLEQFDATFAPSARRRLDKDCIPDYHGYECLVTKAELDRTKQTREAILRLELEFLNGDVKGAWTEQVYFFRDKDQANRLGTDLITMGYPALAWTKANGKSFAHELKEAIKSMRGLVFKCAKKTSSGKDKNGKAKDYANFYINAKLRRQEMPPEEEKKETAGASAGATSVNAEDPF